MVSITPVASREPEPHSGPQPGAIGNCARCGRDHAADELDWHEFQRPMRGVVRLGGVTGEGTFTHWAMCPINDEPILFWRGRRAEQ